MTNSGPDKRLYNGLVRRVQKDVGVVYNSGGAGSEALITNENVTVGILTRNRRQYLCDLIESIDATLPSTVRRYVLVNNCDDDTERRLPERYPNWQMEAVQAKDFPVESEGMRWLRLNRPQILPPGLRASSEGYGPTRSIAWLYNRMLRNCGTRFLIHFDDDMLVKPGWYEYLCSMQRAFHAYAVINNFGAYLMDTAVVSKIGWFDERFVSSHGFEDNDYVARLNESRLRWVLGFNENHDWRSAEDGNPRGSSTGSDLFVHRYAKREGGFSAYVEEAMAAKANPDYFGNAMWYSAKWEHVTSEPGTQDRPPFKGYLLRRREESEPDWYPADTIRPLVETDGSKRLVPTPLRHTESASTTVEAIDLLRRPETATVLDRYLLVSRWCKNKRVLDAGCGHGFGSAILYDLGCREILGLDKDRQVIVQATERHARNGLSFAKEDLLALPVSLHRRFDVVVCIEVLAQLSDDDARRVLQGLSNTIVDGGTVIVTAMVNRSDTSRVPGEGFTASAFSRLLRDSFPTGEIALHGVEECRMPECGQWFSRWHWQVSEAAKVVVAIVERISSRSSLSVARHKDYALRVKMLGKREVPRISILIPNRNTLPYLQLCIRSCREYLTRSDHELIVLDDGSTDGSAAWLDANTARFRMKALFNTSGVRLGIVGAYNELVRAASEPVVWLVHSDMVFARGADRELWRHFGLDTAATSTRVEPPLHNAERHRLQHDFGLDALNFREEDFLRWAEKAMNPRRATMGLFAPVMMWKKDYVGIGGHDDVFAPQSREDSDLFNRMKLAGLSFVQSWSSLCYHFSGRGSRRKDDIRADSLEWQQSNRKNERNFVRKWGTSVRHDAWLDPIVCKPRAITLVGLLGNELSHVTEWLELLEPYVREIVLIDDSKDGSAAAALEFVMKASEQSPLVQIDKIRVFARSLDHDFAASRNAAHSEASHDWLFHVDLDERPDMDLLEHLQDRLAAMEAAGHDVCGFRRLNLLDGVVVNDIPRSEWTEEGLKRARATPPMSSVRHSDIQFRLMRRRVVWVNKVHEMPAPVVPLLRDQAAPTVIVSGHGWIVHRKTLSRQSEQNRFYDECLGPCDV